MKFYSQQREESKMITDHRFQCGTADTIKSLQNHVNL